MPLRISQKASISLKSPTFSRRHKQDVSVRSDFTVPLGPVFMVGYEPGDAPLAANRIQFFNALEGGGATKGPVLITGPLLQWES